MRWSRMTGQCRSLPGQTDARRLFGLSLFDAILEVWQQRCALNGSSDALGIAQYLWAAAGGSGAATYGSISHLSFVLPTNVAFISVFGTVLNTTASAVPGPATWAMMLTGFGLIVGLYGGELQFAPSRPHNA